MLELELKDDYQKTVASNIESDGYGTINGTILCIEYDDVYRIEYSRLVALDMPPLFGGFMSIKMDGLPNAQKCNFTEIFSYPDNAHIRGCQIEGCILKVSKKESYWLPQEMYIMSKYIEKANNSNNEFDRWEVINTASNSSKNIKFTGFKDDVIIETPEKVHIDIIQNSDGSIELSPNISNIPIDIFKKYKDRMVEENRDGIVVTDCNKKLIAKKQLLNGVKKIISNNRIPKDDVSKFFINPQAFLCENEESAEDNSISLGGYRIIGIGEPYIGYFGSVNLDSPIAEALMQDNDPILAKQIQDKIDNTIQSHDINELKTLRDDVKLASQQEKVSFESLDTEFFKSEYDILDKRLSKVFKKIDEAGGENNKLNKAVIKILPNDDIEIIYNNITTKKLSQIDIENYEISSAFKNLTFEPKKHQINGVNWLIDLYDNKYSGGILADDMGLGKTYQVIAFLNYLFSIKKINGRVLIVAPTILIDTWDKEVKRFIKDQSKIKVKILRGKDLGYRSKQINAESKSYNYFEPSEILEIEDYPNIIITTYQTMSNYQFSFSKQNEFNFECIVYDEAHNIKNPNAQISQAARAISSNIPFNILLSGTPVENELRDLWALFDVFDPAHFGSWKKFKKEFVSDSSENIDDKLQDKVGNYLLRRLKSEHLTDLPSKEEKISNIFFSIEDQDKYLDTLNADKPALERLHKLKSISLLANSKTEALIALLEQIKENGEKAIVFIISRKAQDEVSFKIKKHFDINVEIINGDTKSQNVNKKLESFKSQDGFGVIVLSTLAAGVGLTIVEANHVIHYERWWNASKEDQASDRVYRIGQTKDVSIYQIIGKLHNGKKSLDEAINELILSKRKTAGFLIPAKSIDNNDIASELFEGKLSVGERLDMYTWDGFEILIKKLYEIQGYECELTPGCGNPEYGADIIVKKEQEIIAIQCKHSKEKIFKNKTAIYQLDSESRGHYKTDNLIAITNSIFDKSAKELAHKRNIRIIERDELIQIIKEYNLDI